MSRRKGAGIACIVLGFNGFLAAMWLSAGPAGPNPLWYALAITNGLIASLGLVGLGLWWAVEDES